MLYDLFICHASEDRESFVRPLAEALKAENVEVWYDEFSLKLGDSIRRALDKGLAHSRFGIVVLSKAFFQKEWPQYELDGLAEREIKGKDKIILPIWHNITHDEVMAYSPSLAGRKAVLSSEGVPKVVSEILSVVHPQGSPLIIARDTLIDWGLTPPVITDKYWLYVVEASNRLPGSGAVIPEESSWHRWGFPLPPKDGGPEKWGERLAWSAMQLNWVKSAEEIPVTALTEPEIVLDFIHNHPGLFETCELFPDLTVQYAPQLTIPGMGGDLEPTFEEEYQKSLESHKRVREKNSSQGSGLTTNNLCPLCDEEWALRHPTFGDYDSVHVAHEYFSGGMFGPEVSPYQHADHLFWLLSSSSSWLPGKIHEYLLDGMSKWHAWLWDYVRIDEASVLRTNGALSEALYDAVHGKAFKWTKRINDDVLNRINIAIKTLKLRDSADDILERFIKYDFPRKYLSSQKQTKRKRTQYNCKKSKKMDG